MVDNNWKYYRHSILVFLVSFGLTGCAFTNLSPTLSKERKIHSQPENNYIPGTTFVYASGRWDKVERVSDSNIHWINHRGNTSVTTSDFTFRPTEWKSATHEGTRNFMAADFYFGSKPYSVWPLAVGKSAAYYENNTWHALNEPYNTYKAYWSCNVEEKANVKVPAGEFDTFKVVCTRYSGSASSNHSYPREYRTWYYAPKINHWVAYERDYIGENRRKTSKRLASIIPSLERVAGNAMNKSKMEQFIQKTLTNASDSEKRVWRSRSVPVTMEFTPVKTFTPREGTLCRQYQQTLVLKTSEEKYYGIACRENDGKWSNPKRQ